MEDCKLSGWQRLSEHWISTEPESELLSVEQVAKAVKEMGLAPSQAEGIREAILTAVKELTKPEQENYNNLAILIRFWTPDLGRTGVCRIELDNQPHQQKVSKNSGFFLIEKTAGDPEHPWKVFCRMVDVLIY